jgi:hypothetical protein
MDEETVVGKKREITIEPHMPMFDEKGYLSSFMILYVFK